MGHQDTKGKSGQDYLKSEFYRLIQTDETIFNFILESSYDGMWYLDLTTDKVFFSSRWNETYMSTSLTKENG
ncbi:MAG: hypothetical protein EA361_00740 [Bacteroidetes bacterium]|nr:MAG: hypothetical protein EA361_00740 [Bacteroidota bacterium]